MKSEELEAKAGEEIKRKVVEDGPADAMVIPSHSNVEWDPNLLQNLSEHELHILGRGEDLVVFLNNDKRVIGWRDDGRKGAEMPAWIDREEFRKAVVDELNLPGETRLGNLEPAELPPVGWTHQAVLFLAPVPRQDQVLRVWASPEDLRIIQCLYGPASFQGDEK